MEKTGFRRADGSCVAGISVRVLGTLPRGGRLQGPLLRLNQLQSRAPSPSAPCGEDASEAGASRPTRPLRHLSNWLPDAEPPLPGLRCLQTRGNQGLPPLCIAKPFSCPQLPRALPPAGPGAQETPAGPFIRTRHLQRGFPEASWREQMERSAGVISGGFN